MEVELILSRQHLSRARVYLSIDDTGLREQCQWPNTTITSISQNLVRTSFAEI